MVSFQIAADSSRHTTLGITSKLSMNTMDMKMKVCSTRHSRGHLSIVTKTSHTSAVLESCNPSIPPAALAPLVQEKSKWSLRSWSHSRSSCSYETLVDKFHQEAWQGKPPVRHSVCSLTNLLGVKLRMSEWIGPVGSRPSDILLLSIFWQSGLHSTSCSASWLNQTCQEITAAALKNECST